MWPIPRSLALAALLLAGPVQAVAQVVPGYNPPDLSRQLSRYRAESFQEINAALHSWGEAWRRGDARGTAGFYTGDATLLLPDGEMLQGRKAVEEALARTVPGTGEMHVGVTDFSVCETMGFALGRYWFRNAAGGSEEGSYVTVLRLENDRWRIRSQMFRRDAVGPTAAAEAAPGPAQLSCAAPADTVGEGCRGAAGPGGT